MEDNGKAQENGSTTTSHRRPKAKSKLKQKSSNADEDAGGSRFKHLMFTALFMFPALLTLISVSGDFVANFGSVFGNISKVLMVLAILFLPILLGIYVKKSRGFLKIILPGLIMALIFPTLHVYVCSPITLRNEEIGTRFSLKTTHTDLLAQICQEDCIDKSKVPSSYSLSMFTPRIAMKARFGHIVDLNLTTTAMVNGEQVKVAKLVLLRSWRSVKGRHHAIHIITRVPVKLKKFEEALQAKQGLILTGRIAKVGKDLSGLRSQLEGRRYFIRPFVLEVFRALPIEDEAKED